MNSVISSDDNLIELYPKSVLLTESRSYSVTVNGQPVTVQKYNSASYVQFAFAGKIDIEITTDEAIEKYTLSPKSYEIPTNRNQNTISFSLTEPRKLILHQPNSLDEKLFIFAEPLEEKTPSIGDVNVTNVLNYGVDNTGQQEATELIQTAIDEVSAQKGVLYFPAGVYKIRQLNLKSNLTLYLAPGAVLEATKEIDPSYGKGLIYIENAENVKVLGRGVINGNGTYWRSRGGWYSLILLKNAKNVLLQDTLLLDPAVANVWMSYSENVDVYNVKILADPEPEFLNTDGFDFWSSRNITIDNVLYKGTDDATSHGGDKNGTIQNNENINVINSVFYGGNGFKIGTTAKQDSIRNVTYENIDVVFANEFSGLWPISGANFENIYFKNIRVEDMLNMPQTDKASGLFQWRIKVPGWQPESSVDKLGSIRNVYINNLKVDDRGGANSRFQGYDAERNISNINFDNLSIEGKTITNSSDAYFDFLPSEKDGNQYVNLNFTQSDPTIVNITAPDIYASESGDFGEFLIARTGNLSQALTVNYTIRGTAENGVDYETIPNSITIPVGASTGTIAIQPKLDNQAEGLETVFISLHNLSNSTQYMLGSNFQAVVNIRD
ncbi:glycosyl hydrolase family 28 protein [Floridanema evergladense]|uniref:Glycosyl hydrolase family 28 protein n=1 Tax=Floridaenema evergladense BLCC-F167 TaxID=3153639 RepID=A0ABV4WLU3_9CYAN